jgi:hypothetical protein
LSRGEARFAKESGRLAQNRQTIFAGNGRNESAMKTPCTAVNVMQRELIGSERAVSSGASTRMGRGCKELMSCRGMTAAAAVRVAELMIRAQELFG